MLTSVFPMRSRPCPVLPDTASITAAIGPRSTSPRHGTICVEQPSTGSAVPATSMRRSLSPSGPSCSALICTALIAPRAPSSLPRCPQLSLSTSTWRSSVSEGTYGLVFGSSDQSPTASNLDCIGRPAARSGDVRCCRQNVSVSNGLRASSRFATSSPGGIHLHSPVRVYA